LIPTPIRQVLSTFQSCGVAALLMGGQACVFYGAAQVSKDIDFVVLAARNSQWSHKQLKSQANDSNSPSPVCKAAAAG
jgi:hypothetical protein